MKMQEEEEEETDKKIAHDERQTETKKTSKQTNKNKINPSVQKPSHTQET